MVRWKNEGRKNEGREQRREKELKKKGNKKNGRMPSNCTTVMLCVIQVETNWWDRDRFISSYYIYWNSIHVDEYLYSIISLYSLVLPHFLPLPLFLIHASRSSITWYIIDYELFFFFSLYSLCTMRSRLNYINCATFRNYASRGYRLSSDTINV